MTLADPHPIDIAITVGHVLSLMLVVWMALRARASSRERRAWGSLAGFLVILVLNQQMDLHVHILEAGAGALRLVGAPSSSPVVRAVCAMLLLAITVVAVRVGCTRVRLDRAPTALVIAGFLLLVVHAAGRAAMFLHVFQGERTGVPMATGLKAAEGVGLALLIVGGLLWAEEVGIGTTRQHGT